MKVLKRILVQKVGFLKYKLGILHGYKTKSMFKISVRLLVKYEFLWSGAAQSGITVTSCNCDFTVPDVVTVLFNQDVQVLSNFQITFM